MIINSLNNRIIYAVIYNPFRQVVRLELAAGCAGCSGFLRAWDRGAWDYLPYCDVFGVWNEYEALGPDLMVIPNDICIMYFWDPVRGNA